MCVCVCVYTSGTQKNVMLIFPDYFTYNATNHFFDYMTPKYLLNLLKFSVTKIFYEPTLNTTINLQVNKNAIDYDRIY